ncbi:hypothetical protein SSJ01_26 [Vibrio phage SSJ01]|nr:hypothetical protein SSJ01_26 [Vibrio phage SSJ01]
MGVCVCYACAIRGKALESIAARWLAGLRSMLAFFARLLTHWLVTCQRVAIYWLST